MASLYFVWGFFLVFFPKAKGRRPRRKGVAGWFFWEPPEEKRGAAAAL